MPLTTLITTITHLRRSPTKYGWAPHKPVLLLTLIELLDRGLVNDNKFVVNDLLLDSFEKQWKHHVNTKHVMDIQKLFFHLQNDAFAGEPLWRTISYSGEVLHKPFYGKKAFFENVQYGQLHPKVYTLLSNHEHRKLIRQILTDIYFPPTT